MMVAAGRGITLMPENLHLGLGTLARPLVEPAVSREISLISVAGRPHASHVQHLIRAIRAHKWDDKTPPANGRKHRPLSSAHPAWRGPESAALVPDRCELPDAGTARHRDRREEDAALSDGTWRRRDSDSKCNG
jgi:hypothetical protein